MIVGLLKLSVIVLFFVSFAIQTIGGLRYVAVARNLVAAMQQVKPELYADRVERLNPFGPLVVHWPRFMHLVMRADLADFGADCVQLQLAARRGVKLQMIGVLVFLTIPCVVLIGKSLEGPRAQSSVGGETRH